MTQQCSITVGHLGVVAKTTLPSIHLVECSNVVLRQTYSNRRIDLLTAYNAPQCICQMVSTVWLAIQYIWYIRVCTIYDMHVSWQ